ncbi:MAG: imidazole glycerol phosphate synthase subunit HisH [Legionellaceae bacterium]|nr:imidazole glycerol phosphate synthase subunit HisH [Legionellaceae bacterium]
MILIVDSGGANISSILFALERLDKQAIVSADCDAIKNASHVILPGVGSADKIMQRLNELKLVDVLPSLTQPVLGICVGMQVLFEFAEEGNVTCLNIIPGKIKKLAGIAPLPHMGWNTLSITQNSSLLKNIPNESYAYFVHSFAAPVLACTCAMTQYGESFSAVVSHQNFFGTQFHPERSGAVGSQILKNFLEL